MTTFTTFGSDIRCLSSGTMSKLLRDMYFADLAEFLKSRYSFSRRRLDVNPLQAKDGWIIGRVQIAFARFADVGHDEDWKSWMDVWNAYLKAMGTVQFKSSYMGETDWIVGGKRYECKDRVSDYEKSVYNGTGEDFERCVVPRLGTIMVRYCGSDEFPPDAVSVLFPFHTPGRYRGGLERHSDYPKPRIGESLCGDRCNYYRDRKFELPVELYEEYREIALAM